MKTLPWLIALCLIGAPQGAPGQNPPATEPPATPAQRMDKLFEFWNRLDQPGFAVTVVRDGQVLYQKTFGLACQEHAVAITPNSVFNLAAAAQPFVGQAVALLENQGRLSLDDDIRKLIPELPDLGTPIRLRHLVFQTSGLRDWLPALQLVGRDGQEITFARVLKVVQAQKKLPFAPGDRVQFSNTNYDLLAETIKRATGKPFSDWTWENLFKPLKMTRTLYRDNYRSIFDDQAFSYNYTRQEYLRGIDTLSVAGSHSLFTSIADLSRWLTDLETARVGSQDVYEKMITPGRLNDGSTTGFSYGWSVKSEAGRRSVVASGTWAGSGAVVAYYPDQKFAFAVLANWDYTPVEGFASDIVDIYLPVPAAPAKPSAPPTAPGSVSPATLDRYVGDYRLGPSQIVTIARTGGQLFLEVPGQRFALTAASETEFVFDLVSARIVFQPDKDGRVHQFVWKQGGAEQLAPKVILAKPTAEDLKELAGSYFNDELDLRVRVEPRGTALAVSRPDAAEVRLTADVKDRFTSGSPIVPAIVFQRNAQNLIIGFTIDSDAVRDLVFKKE